MKRALTAGANRTMPDHEPGSPIYHRRSLISLSDLPDAIST